MAAFDYLLCCCCNPSRFKSDAAAEARREKLEKSLSATSDIGSGSDTLLEDEGANYQQQLWELALRRKLLQYNQASVDTDLEMVDSSTPEGFLQSLTVAYADNGCAPMMPHVRQTFLLLEPFIIAINTMSSCSAIGSLVWGSLTMIFKSVLRFSNLFEDTSQMLSGLAKALPRFQLYVEIFHTPRLHLALRDIYDGFLDFCFKTIEVLQSNVCYAVWWGRWISLSSEFNETKEWLNSAGSEFEKEARLADVQEQCRRHTEVMARIGGIGIASREPYVDTVTNVDLPRNERFVGRIDVLNNLHSQLMPSFQGDISSRARSSCVVHAVGGMGKTETALEYAYRYMHCYTHIFWLRSQTQDTLTTSFLDVVTKLGLDEKGTDPSKRVQDGLEWFRSTTSPWLLIFDNAENTSTIRRFWPSGNRGAIIVTSQNPQLAHYTKFEIHLQPMHQDEGSALIQSFLNRGGSEQDSAQLLSTTLGGLPLAIAHFAGFVARSQCPLNQICKSLDNRMKSSRVWRMENPEQLGAYDSTLSTVWNMAFSRLTPDSKKLLEFLAFLDADQVPVKMFVRPQNTSATNTEGWQYWDTEGFDAALAILLERHLVERYIIPAGHFLRTHRALQRSVLQELDRNVEKRQAVFDEIVLIVRKAFPEANIITRGDTSKYEQSGRYLTQIISIHTAYVQSQPPMELSLPFAEVLSDVGYYGVNNAVQAAVLVLMETAESTCTALLDKRPEQARPIFANILGPMQSLVEYQGIEGRHKAFDMSERCIAIREDQIGDTPRDQWTKLDCVNFGRAYNAKGVSLVQLNKVEEAKQWFDSALEFYQLGGNEETLKSRIGHAYSFQMLPVAAAQRSEEFRALAERSLKLIAEAVGEVSPLHLQTKFLTAICLFTTGSVDEALGLHKEVFEKRLVRQGKSHHLTLGSQYSLAVCYRNVDDLENAEKLLKENLEHGCATMAWRDDDIVRSKFRLSLVLRAQDKLEEASALRDEIADQLSSIRPAALITSSEFTDEDDMKLLDFGVSFFHGRTAGVWSKGRYW